MARQSQRNAKRNAQKRSVWPYIVIGLLVLANLVVIALLVRDFRGSSKEEATTTTAVAVETTKSNIGESYNVTGGTLGAYGMELKLNAGTENEETKYIYVLPSGTYRITNTGAYPTQVAVYSATEKNQTEAGLEEPIEQPDTTPKTIAPEDYAEVVIDAGFGLSVEKDATVTVERVS